MNPEQDQTQPQTITTPAAVATKPLWRDLLIPASIVIAGVFVGIGLYFGGDTGPVKSGGGLPSATETTAERVERLANDAGVKTKDLAACLQSGRTKALVQADSDNAVETGGRGTPWSIVIGPTGITYPINGSLPAAAVDQLIEIARTEGAVPEELNTEGINTAAVAPVTEDDWIKGSSDAVVTVVEYSDFDCPFCSRFHQAMGEVMADNPDTAWVYRHFPLDQLHPEARYVAEAAECVGELEGQDAFWKFTDAYFAG